MPGTNGGTGYPYHLQCGRCKRSLHSVFHDAVHFRRGYRLVATGRTKPLKTAHRGIRCTDRRIEYRCLDCGHVGWSKHIATETLAGAPPRET